MPITTPHDFFIQWHLTDKCNLRCTHCYQTDNSTGELSLPEIKEVVAEVEEMLNAWSDSYDISFSPSFNITGGEPFLRKDLFDILGEIRKSNFDIYLLSNGILIDHEKAHRLLHSGVTGVQISIEGPEEIHDLIRGKGSFKASIRGINHLLEGGLRVTLNVTLSGVNADSFHEMIRLSSSLGVHKLGFSRLVPSGRGAGLLNKMLTAEKVRKIYNDIFSLDTRDLDIVTGDPVASQMSCSVEGDKYNTVATGGCAAGISGLTILSDGTITPCRRLNIPIGNVRDISLREAWSASRVLNMLRDKSKYSGRCGSCSRWRNCRGCRAIAYAYSLSKGEHDFLADDPQCFINQEN
ncbi:MAG: radical SAM protein [Nitrospirae bacterium]|nr:radical SAM protein [Nitrospirota bacterium]